MLYTGDVEALPFPSGSFDTTVDTFGLCVFSHPEAALQELARVTRSDGRVLLLEHTRSSFPPLGAYQDLTAGPVAASGKGCVWNQDVLSWLPRAGLRAVDVKPALGGLICAIQAEKVS